MPRKLQTLKQGMQIECYCPAVHKNTHKCMEESRKKLLKKSAFVIFFTFSYKILVKDSLRTNALVELILPRMTSLLL